MEETIKTFSTVILFIFFVLLCKQIKLSAEGENRLTRPTQKTEGRGQTQLQCPLKAQPKLALGSCMGYVAWTEKWNFPVNVLG